MCPHSDRAANTDMSYATFVMTNIIPQAPNVNRKAWAEMENYCRELVRHHDSLFIIAGPIGEGGTGTGRRPQRQSPGPQSASPRREFRSLPPSKSGRPR